MSKVIALIPARGGSKSIPLKNIKTLAGQPLILWSVQELLGCDKVDEIWISTDSQEIKAVLEIISNNRVKVYERDPANAQDTSSTEDAMIEFIKKRNFTNEKILLVQATSPFTLSRHFEEAIDQFEKGEYDSLLSGVRFKRFFWDFDGLPINYDFEKRPRRQDFEGVFLENGAFYLSSADNIVKSKNRLSGRICQYEMPEYTAVEIDEKLDWLLAENLMTANGMKPQFSTKIKVKLFATDVDGVLTDAGMYYSASGDELKKFNTHDGKAFELLRNSDIKTAIITSEDTHIVANRAKKLKVDYLYQGKAHNGKLDALKEICKQEGLELSQVAYIGDDVNCKEALQAVGFAACPNNALPLVKSIPGIKVLEKSGGEGAVREFVEAILN